MCPPPPLAPPRALSRRAARQALAAELQRRQDAERQARRQRDRERERDNGGVHPDVLQAGEIGGLHRDQRPRRDVRDRKPGDCASRTKDDRLCEELAKQPHPTGAERGANGQLRLACRCAREKEVGDVRAGHEQHEADGAEENQQRPSNIPQQHVVEGKSVERQRVVRLAKRRLKLCADSPQVTVGLRERHAWLRPCDHREELASSSFRSRGAERVVVHERRVDLRIVEQARSRGEDADDFHRRARDRDRAAEHARVAAELALPEPVIEHGHPGMSRLVLTRQQAPAERDRQAKQAEQAVAHVRSADLARFAGAQHGEHAARIRLDLLERPRVLADAHEVRRRQRVGRAVGIERGDPIQPIRIPERQRRQQDALDDAEDGAVRPDSERQRRQGHGGEARRAAQHPQRVPDILAQLGHVFGSCHHDADSDEQWAVWQQPDDRAWPSRDPPAMTINTPFQWRRSALAPMFALLVPRPER